MKATLCLEEQQNSRIGCNERYDRPNFDFVGLNVATHNDHIEVEPVLGDVLSNQEFGNMPAADNEMDWLQWRDC